LKAEVKGKAMPKLDVMPSGNDLMEQGMGIWGKTYKEAKKPLYGGGGKVCKGGCQMGSGGKCMKCGGMMKYGNGGAVGKK
jgi:hypothetical protein